MRGANIILASIVISCSSASGPGALPGYVHTLARSRFPIGDILGSQDIVGMDQIIGSQGVFSTEMLSKMASGTPDANAPSLGRGPFPGGDSAQNAAVLAYFVGAGLPADQVSTVVPFDGFEALITPATMSPTQTVLSTWVTSVVCRSYQGIKISDSFAWARFDAQGESVTESVYWPELPLSTMQALALFQALLSDSSRRPTYLARLPQGGASGELVIHHTPGESTEFSADPYFDIKIDGVVLHFDVNGSAQLLPDSESPCP
jgi:hypothetical protein